jgi:uncharacterized protein YndB with AHSA1/START domain
VIDIQSTSKEEPIIVMTRTLDAPRELVWTMFTEPKHLSKWFGGRGFETLACEMDVRPGGKWHHVMRTPDGHEMVMDVVFVEVAKPERLVWQGVDYGKKTPHPSSHMTVTLEEVGKKTKWKLVTRFASMADREIANSIGFADAIAQGNDRLAELLETMGLG